MDLWSPGAVPTVVATAVRYSISCEMCSRSKLLIRHLLQSWVMDLWSPGVMPTVVATAERYSISCEMCSISKLLVAHLPQSWVMGSVVTWGRAGYGGDSNAVQDQLRDVAADPSFLFGICCNPG